VIQLLHIMCKVQGEYLVSAQVIAMVIKSRGDGINEHVQAAQFKTFGTK
jgi:hypothetical protein